MSELEEIFLVQIRSACLPEPQREYVFAPGRLWRFDFAWSDMRIAVEIEGGIYARGRHTRGAQFEQDAAKYNTAAIMGWSVLRFGPNQVKGTGRQPLKVYEAIDTLKRAIEVKVQVANILEIKDVCLEPDESVFTGWIMRMNGSDGVPASLGEIALWKIIQRQSQEITLLRERVRGLEALRSVKGVVSKIDNRTK